MKNLHDHPDVQVALAALTDAILGVIVEKAHEQAGWLGELVAGVTELHQDTPESSAAWRDGLVAVLRQAWERAQAEQSIIADALAGSWVGAVAAERLGAPATTPEVRAMLSVLHRAAHPDGDDDGGGEP